MILVYLLQHHDSQRSLEMQKYSISNVVHISYSFKTCKKEHDWLPCDHLENWISCIA